MTPFELITQKILTHHSEVSDCFDYEAQSELDFRIQFSGLRRRLGEGSLSFTAKEASQLSEWGFPSAALRPLHIHGRIALLMQAARQQQEQALPGFIHQLFVRGDSMEQCAILCALALLPQPQRFAETAAQATRGYVREVFETLACHNPYPAQYLPDISFNQMILKALFLGCPVNDVIGLEERNNTELQRMVHDFVRERRLAGRPVPEDTVLIL